MRRATNIAIVLVVAGAIAGGGTWAWQVAELKREIWLQDHVLFRCDGAVIRVNGDRGDAEQFARKHCPLDYDLTIANQEYDGR